MRCYPWIVNHNSCSISGVNEKHFWWTITLYGRVDQGIVRNINISPRMNVWRFRPRLCTVKATLGRGQLALMRWILFWNMPLVQDRSLDLLTSSQLATTGLLMPPRMPSNSEYRPTLNKCILKYVFEKDNYYTRISLLPLYIKTCFM